MPANNTLFDSDAHVIEPGDLWTERIEKRFRDRAPRIGKVAGQTGDFFLCEDLDPFSAVAGGFLGAKRDNLAEFEKWQASGSVSKDVRPGAWNPPERIKDMTADGVGAAAIYPTSGARFFRVKDAGLQNAIFRTYNDWMSEFFSYDAKHLAGLALISLHDYEAAVAEVRRVAKLGFQGVIIPISRPYDTGYDDPGLDPFWRACVDTGMVVGIHTSAVAWWPVDKIPTMRVGIGCADFPVRRSLTEMIFGGVFDRFPQLKVVVAEFEIGWIPHFLWWSDHRYKLRPAATAPIKMLPSEYAKKHVWATVSEDPLLSTVAAAFGEDRLLWASDYPHVESTWPKSREYIDRVFKGTSPKFRDMATRENARKLYRYSLE